MTKIINTSKNEVNLHWLGGGNPSAIEAQEAQGQNRLINSSVLPVKCIHNTKILLENYGVEFGEPLENDPLFCNAKLPEGWTKKATSHTMWSELIDTDGNVKTLIFYKAAFYDRNAHIEIQETP